MKGSAAVIAAVSALACLAIAFISARRPRWAVLTPLTGSMGIALAICSSGQISYPSPSAYGWAVILTPVAVFIFVAILNNSGTNPTIQAVTGDSSTVSVRCYITICVGYLIGLLIYLRTIASTFGITTLITNPASIRSDSSAQSYLETFPLYGKVLFYLGPIAFVLTAFPRLVAKSALQRNVIRISIMSALLASQLLLLQRTNVFVCIAWATALQFSHRQGSRTTRNRRGASVLLAILAIVAFQGVGAALGKNSVQNYNTTAGMSPTLINSGFSSIALYWSGGIPALAVLSDSPYRDWPMNDPNGNTPYGAYNPQTYGAATFSTPLKLIPDAPHWNQIAPFVQLPAPTNVYTWAEPWYRDFRLPGVIAFSWATAEIATRLYRRRNNSARSSLASSMMLGMTAFAPFINVYITLLFATSAAMTWFATSVSSKLRNRTFPAGAAAD